MYKRSKGISLQFLPNKLRRLFGQKKLLLILSQRTIFVNFIRSEYRYIFSISGEVRSKN